MQSNWASKKDWALFRSKIAGWQEAYIGKLNKEYIELLSSGGSEADKFWELYERMRRDKRCAGVQISMRGSDPLPIICCLINEGVIQFGNLNYKCRKDESNDLHISPVVGARGRWHWKEALIALCEPSLTA